MVSQNLSNHNLIDPSWTFVPTIHRAMTAEGWQVEFCMPVVGDCFFGPAPQLMARWGDVESTARGAFRVHVATESQARSLVFQLLELAEEINRF